MKALDFKYDNHWLSDYGFIICTFNGSGGFNTVSSGATLEFKTVMQQNGRFFGLAGSKYSEAIFMTFEICKESDDPQDAIVTQEEIRNISKWLNRTEFCEFMPVPTDGYNSDIVRYYGAFNIAYIEHCDNVVGFELTFRSNRPFGLGENVELNYTVSTNNTFAFNVDTDEVGTLYPELVEITVGANGNLTLENETENRITYIGNCTNGEKITLDCFNQIVTTTEVNHKIYNDFNFNFPRLVNTLDSTNNVFRSSLPCSYKIVYKPVRKVVI